MRRHSFVCACIRACVCVCVWRWCTMQVLSGFVWLLCVPEFTRVQLADGALVDIVCSVYSVSCKVLNLHCFLLPTIQCQDSENSWFSLECVEMSVWDFPSLDSPSPADGNTDSTAVWNHLHSSFVFLSFPFKLAPTSVQTRWRVHAGVCQ